MIIPIVITALLMFAAGWRLGRRQQAEEIQRLAERLKTSSDSLDEAVKKNQPDANRVTGPAEK
jgi:hypothetical protein